MKYFATFTPAITVEFNNKRYVMRKTKEYSSVAELFTALAANAANIHDTKVSIMAEREDRRCTPYV